MINTKKRKNKVNNTKDISEDSAVDFLSAGAGARYMSTDRRWIWKTSRANSEAGEDQKGKVH